MRISFLCVMCGMVSMVTFGSLRTDFRTSELKNDMEFHELSLLCDLIQYESEQYGLDPVLAEDCRILQEALGNAEHSALLEVKWRVCHENPTPNCIRELDAFTAQYEIAVKMLTLYHQKRLEGESWRYYFSNPKTLALWAAIGIPVGIYVFPQALYLARTLAWLF